MLTDPQIRIWSAGCATGEEPFTLAMVMAEQLGLTEMARRVKIYATDVDLDALTHARADVYTAKSVADVPEELRDRYFQPDPRGRGFVVDPVIRRAVVFGRQDLTRDPPISRVDLLACRNTLIYLNAQTQALMIPRLHYSLSEGGYLFLGQAELVVHGGAGLAVPVSLQHRIFVAIPQHPRPSTPSVALPEHRPLAFEGLETPSSQQGRDPSLADVVFQFGPVVQLLVEPGGLLVGASGAAREILAIGPDAFGRPLLELRVASTLLDLAGAVHDALTVGSSHELGAIQCVTLGEAAVDLDVRVLPLLGAEERVHGASIIFVDRSETVQLQKRFRQVHHELQTAYEELQSTNEELVTSNGELQSSYEELETTNEELHSSNEQLETNNDELTAASDAVERLNATLVELNGELNRESDHRRRVMDNSPFAVVVLNAQLLIEEWNHAATDLWGLREDEARGQAFFGLDFGLPLEPLQAPVRACFLEGAIATTLDLEAVNRRGHRVDLPRLGRARRRGRCAVLAMLAMNALESVGA